MITQEPPADAPTPLLPDLPPRRRPARGRLLAVAAVAALAAGVALAPPGWIAALVAATDAPGPGTVAALAAGYVAAGVLLVPAPLVHVVAGFLLGTAGGAALAIPASTAGACAAFALGRWLVRERAERLSARWPVIATLGEAVGASGFRVVLLLRLAPFAPFTVLNYALGATPISLRHFALASMLGSVPGLLLDVYVGSVARSADELLGRGGLTRAGAGSLLASLAVTGLVLVAIAQVLRRTLRAAAGPAPAAPGEPPARAA